MNGKKATLLRKLFGRVREGADDTKVRIPREVKRAYNSINSNEKAVIGMLIPEETPIK